MGPLFEDALLPGQLMKCIQPLDYTQFHVPDRRDNVLDITMSHSCQTLNWNTKKGN